MSELCAFRYKHIATDYDSDRCVWTCASCCRASVSKICFWIEEIVVLSFEKLWFYSCCLATSVLIKSFQALFDRHSSNHPSSCCRPLTRLSTRSNICPLDVTVVTLVELPPYAPTDVRDHLWTWLQRPASNFSWKTPCQALAAVRSSFPPTLSLYAKPNLFFFTSTKENGETTLLGR